MGEDPEDLQFTDKLPRSRNIQPTRSLLLLGLRICLGKCIIQLSNGIM